MSSGLWGGQVSGAVHLQISAGRERVSAGGREKTPLPGHPGFVAAGGYGTTVTAFLSSV